MVKKLKPSGSTHTAPSLLAVDLAAVWPLKFTLGEVAVFASHKWYRPSHNDEEFTAKMDSPAVLMLQNYKIFRRNKHLVFMISGIYITQ